MCLELLIAVCLLAATATEADYGDDGGYDFDPEDVQAFWPESVNPLEPPTMAFEIRFQASGQSIREDKLYNGSQFVYPSDFKQIIVECNSSYPKKWKFSTNFIRDKNITAWYINKTRFVRADSIWNTSTSYTFQTRLAITFADGKDASLQYAFNCLHVKMKDLSSHISLIANKTHLNVSFLDGAQEPPPIGRYGKNKDCELTLHLDRTNDTFGCSFTGNGSSVGIHSKAVNCKNTDECTALAQSNNCTSSIVEGACPGACISFVQRRVSGIFVCEVGEQFSKPSNYNSMAAVYYFSLSQPKKLYLEKEIPTAPVHEMLTIQLLNSSAEVYVDETLFFNCTGSASYFSQGFYWILEYNDGRQELLGSEPTSPVSNYLQESEAYTTLTAIHFNKSRIQVSQSQNITIYCLGPTVNRYKWENVSMQIDFKNARRNPLDPLTSSTRRILILLGIVLSFVVVLLAFLFFGVYYIRKRTREANTAFGRLSQDEIDDFLHGDPNQDLAIFYPYNTDYEIGRGQFKIESKVLGDGQFGQVLRGTLGKAPVAIKTVKKCVDIMYVKALLSELKIMCYVGRHENIVSLIGACTEGIDKREVYLLVEFCENGCLLSYIKTHRSAFLDYLTASSAPVSGCSGPLATGGEAKLKKESRISRQRELRWLKQQSVVNYQNTITKRMSSRDLLRWALEIAAGMEHLSSKNVIHGDLAARNVLLTANLTAKVGDFGLSKQLFDYSIYVQRIECPLPLRWMAVESLRDLEFSKESDVWSYGVTLYEIFSLGQLPYPAIQWDFDSWKLIRDGYRMEKPDYGSDEVYRLMLDCWHIDPMERPWFSELTENFQALLLELDERFPSSSSNFNRRRDVTSWSRHNSRNRSTML